MFLRQLGSSSSSFLPRGVRSSSASSSSSQRLLHPPHPWYSLQGAPPRPPAPPPPPPPRLPHPHPQGDYARGWRSLHTSAGLRMEPPFKRLKSTEEKRSTEEQGRRPGGAESSGGRRPGGAEATGGRNHESRARDHDGRKPSRERTKTGSKDRQRRDSVGRKDPQTFRSSPELGRGPEQKPNPWFKDRAAREQGPGPGRRNGPEEPGKEAHSSRPVAPGQEAVDDGEPPPPGTSPLHQRTPQPLQRRWETAPGSSSSGSVPPPEGGAAFDFSVMSYNILSQQLLQDNAYLYRHCPAGVLRWRHRLPNLLAEIQQHDADILCLQEVQENHYEDQIKPALQALGYQCEYKKRTGSKPDGCAVIFKTSRLSLLSSNPVEYLRVGDALLDRDNVGLVVLLQPHDAAGQSGAFICVANTHLLYNPRRGDIKLAQLAILLAEINRLTRLPDGSAHPVVLCGDFNSTPWSPLYNFLTTGRLNYSELPISAVSGQESSPRGQRQLSSPIWSRSLGISHRCQYENKPSAESSPSSPTVEGAISNLSVEDLAAKSAFSFNKWRIEHGLKLRSSYQHVLQPGQKPEVTTCHSRTAMTVDYILYTPEEVSTPASLPGGRGLHLLSRLSLVGQSELEHVNRLPNQHHSSDHLPLLARFRLPRR
ncbi:uncharacterized protein V6R79_001953 [Siganus canaliculatus]